MVAEIIAIGSELLSPYRTDTNSLWLTEKLNNLGIDVKLKAVIGDELERLVEYIREALKRADVIIATGGLGPTEDDLTREAFAQVLGRWLIRNEEILERLRRRFEKYGFKMTPNNERQADVIEGAEVLNNAYGSAPGMFIGEGEKAIILLPGPPREMEPMFEREAFPRLAERSRGFRMARRVLRISGLTESAMDDIIAPIYKPYTNPTTTILSAVTGLEVHMTALAETQERAQQLVDELSEKIEQRLGQHVFSREGESLEQVVGRLLATNGLTLAVAESCTGGLIAKRITDVPGSSRYFLSGIVAYSNEAKANLLRVPSELIQAHGAVSPEVVEAMARGIMDRTGAHIGLAVTGIAGPEGGTPEKPVGLVYLGLAYGGQGQHRKLQIPGDRERVRELTTQFALDWVRRKVMQSFA
ncbi:MAG: competence/damage-inducible protein A [Acidobacteria bacterium]|nr:competence/damage-inducible protein A [Acidobacteriota bacterium]